MIKEIYTLHSLMLVAMIVIGYGAWILADEIRKNDFKYEFANLKSAFSMYPNWVSCCIVLIIIGIPFFLEGIFIYAAFKKKEA